MFKLTKLIQASPEADAAGRDRLTAGLNATAKPGALVARSMLQPTLPGVYNGGDYIWHLQFTDEAGYRAWRDGPEGNAANALLADKQLVAHVDSAAYQGGRSGSKPDGLDRGAYRTLFLSVNRAPNPAAIDQFDRETFAMGDYIHTIRNWQISRVSEATGARNWTHVWEQEYADISGLRGAYMLHPYHWGHIDRWFDPECTDFMIDTYLCHTFCNFDGSMIAPKR